jgi:hypothetical protein
MLHVLLGVNHPVTITFETFWTIWNASQNQLLNIKMCTPGLFPVLTICWVQLCILLWFSQQSTENANIVAPNFAQLMCNIHLQAVWEPYIPDQYLTVLPIPLMLPTAPQVPTLHPPPVQQIGLPAAPAPVVPAQALG